jgi:hypothetical protein
MSFQDLAEVCAWLATKLSGQPLDGLQLIDLATVLMFVWRDLDRAFSDQARV